MAITANGMIAKLDGNTDFTSQEDWASFKKIATQTKAVVIGRNTYNSYLKSPEQLWPECKFFVLTSDENLKSDYPNVEILVSTSPNKILELIEKQGFNEVCIAGGGFNNSNFLKDNLIDEIYLDIEPTIYSNGIPLFCPLADFETRLELLEVNKLSSQTVQLHYKVIKS